MPKAGLEPARLAAPPPQDGVSANSTTSAFIGIRIRSSVSAISLGATVSAQPAEEPGPARSAVAVVAAAVERAAAPVERAAVGLAARAATEPALWRLRE